MGAGGGLASGRQAEQCALLYRGVALRNREMIATDQAQFGPGGARGEEEREEWEGRGLPRMGASGAQWPLVAPHVIGVGRAATVCHWKSSRVETEVQAGPSCWPAW